MILLVGRGNARELDSSSYKNVWVLVDLPKGHRAIGTKWVYRNKKDERGIVVRNKARLVAQGHTYEERNDYDAYLLQWLGFFKKGYQIFMAYASYMGFEDPHHPDKVYKVVKALYGLHQAPRAWYDTLATYLLSNGFQRGKIDQTLFIKRKKRHIYKLSKNKYVHEILKKFNYTYVKSASTPTDLERPLVKDADAEDFLHVQVAYTDSDYAGATLDRKSTTGGCQFLGNRLISWQCRKQTVVATSTTEAKYVATANCYGQGRKHAGCSKSVGCDHTTIGYQFTMSYRHQELTSPEQTATALASPEQTATGKDISNPFIVGSLLKTIWLSKCNQVISNETMLSKANGYGKELIKSRLWPDFCDKHNMVAFLEKSTGSAGFHQIIDFITRSHVCYALTKKPEVCVSFIRQFWRSAEILTDDNGTVKIHATIDGQSLSITKGSLWRHLKLDNQDGITSLPTTEIFAQLALMGYATKLR
ncbi:putative ribonuclease H-like domain-containing protein [Tanacetum coccineum]